jgi:hypothetical protein
VKSNDPVSTDEIDPLLQEIQQCCFRRYVGAQEILHLAESKRNKGVTIRDIQATFGVSKQQSQRKLKYFHARRILFTAKDLIRQGLELPPTFKNYRPQRYYANTLKGDILRKMKEDYGNVLIRTTESPRENHSTSFAVFQALEEQKANSFFEVLRRLPFSYAYIHKINLIFSIGKKNYKETSEIMERPIGNGEECLGRNRRLYYKYHPNGTVQLFIASTKYPVKIQNENDVNSFFSLMGQVKERVINHISDTTEDIIPEVNNWILKQCDINKDIPITDKAQIYLPDIQLKTAGRVFRMYVKSLQHSSADRCEESKEVNLSLSSLPELIFPELQLSKKIDILSYKIENLPLRINSSAYHPYRYDIPTIF